MHKQARIGPLLLISGLAAALLVAAWHAADATLLVLFREQLEQARDSELPSLVRRSVRTSSAGARLCITALQSQRGAVVAAAQEVLVDEIARWHLLPHLEAAQRRQQLASQLAEQGPFLSDQGRIAASELATLLLSPTVRPAPSTDRMLKLACEKVLRANLDRPAGQQVLDGAAQVPTSP